MSDRETTAAAFAALAEAHLAAAISLTDWPQRHRLKQLQGDLTDLRDELEEWESAPEAAEPLAAPKPPLPTEVGAVIANVVPLFDGRDPQPSDTCAVMALGKYDQWVGLDLKGYARAYAADQIADWTPARIVADEPVSAAEPDLMDESDKRPRIDSDGDYVEWLADDDGWGCFGTFDAPTLDRYCKAMDVTIVGWARETEHDPWEAGPLPTEEKPAVIPAHLIDSAATASLNAFHARRGFPLATLDRLAPAVAQGWRDDTRAALEAMVAHLAAVAANHPDPRCEVGDDDPPITCGWKRLAADLLNALGPELRDPWEAGR